MDENQITVSPDEAKAEQEALAEAKADEVRSRVVSELGLSEDDHSELIEKLVQRELDGRKKLSEAIGQKIKYREAAKAGKPTPPAPPQPVNPVADPEAIRKQTETTVTAALEQRDLDEMDYPDEIKDQIKHVASVTGVSVRKAEKDPYVQYLIGEAQKAGRINEAAIPRGSRPASITTPTTEMPNFDMSTEDGRKQYDEWKKNKG